MKTLLSSLSQQLSIPMISLAIEYVNSKELDIESKLINFWNSLGDMLNKKFKGKLKRSSGPLKKVSTTTKKSEEIVEEKKKVVTQNRKEEMKSTNDVQSYTSHYTMNSNIDAHRKNLIYPNDTSKSNYLYNYKPSSLIGNSVIPNYLVSNMAYSNAPRPIYYRVAMCNPVPTKPIFNSFTPYPQMRATGNYFYIPIHQN